MGRGDIKTKKGKIRAGSFGKTRPKNKNTAEAIKIKGNKAKSEAKKKK